MNFTFPMALFGPGFCRMFPLTISYPRRRAYVGSLAIFGRISLRAIERGAYQYGRKMMNFSVSANTGV